MVLAIYLIMKVYMAINSGYHWNVKQIDKCVCIYMDEAISWWHFPPKMENEVRP